MPIPRCRTLIAALTAALALTAFTAASALAAGAPIAETRAATAIKPTEANLNGYVNPNGAETKLWFEYGPTTSYGTRTKEQTTNVVKEPVKLIEGLQTKKGYHFRLVASNSYGTSYGGDREFTTTSELPEFVATFPTNTRGSVGQTYLTTANGRNFQCRSGEGSGQISSGKVWSGTIEFRECTFESPYGQKCHTPGAGAGEIWTEALKGTPVYSSKEAKEAAIHLQNASGGAAMTGNIECSVFKWGAVTGSALARVQRINSSGYELPLEFLAGYGGVQSPHAYETAAGKYEAQMLFEREDISLQAVFALRTNEPVELKA